MRRPGPAPSGPGGPRVLQRTRPSSWPATPWKSWGGKLALFYQNDDWGKGAMEGMSRAVKAKSGRGALAPAVPYELIGATAGEPETKLITTLGLSGPITFAPNRHHGLNAVRLMRTRKAADASYEQVTTYQMFTPLF